MRLTTLVLSDEERDRLQRNARLPTSTKRASFRAGIILRVADNASLKSVGRGMRCSRNTIRKWVRRFEASRLDGLADAGRSGRPRRITPEQRCSVIAVACSKPEENGLPGVTEWSGSLIANRMVETEQVDSISPRSVQRILERTSLKPHRCDYWKRATDPLFAEKMPPIIDLYLNPPADGPVWCADEKTSIQALERRFPDLPLRRPGELVKREAEYVRHGTRCLTAGFEVATGQVVGLVTPSRPATVFIEFLRLLHGHVPAGQVIHLVTDNLNTHKGKEVAGWRDDHPGRLQMHYLPNYASWLNQIEMFFGTMVRRLLRRGDFSSVEDLEAQIKAFIETHNRCFAHPYRWTYTGDPLAA